MAYEAADKMDRFPVADVESSATVDPSTAGVGFGVEESLARGVAIAEGLEDDESMPGDASLDPLSLLFDGDDEEEPSDGADGPGGGDRPSYAYDRRGFSDVEVRRRLGLLDEDDDAVRSELSSLIDDIAAEAGTNTGSAGTGRGRDAKKPASKGFGRNADDAIDRALWGTFGVTEEEKAEAMRAFQGKYGGADDDDAEAVGVEEEEEEGDDDAAYPVDAEEEDDGGYSLIGDGDE